MASPNTLVLLVSYAFTGADEDPGAMVVDQFSFGPRRVYVIVRLVAHGDSWGVDGVTVVPYVAVSTSCVAMFCPELILFSYVDDLCYSSAKRVIRTLLLRLCTHG